MRGRIDSCSGSDRAVSMVRVPRTWGVCVPRTCRRRGEHRGKTALPSWHLGCSATSQLSHHPRRNGRRAMAKRILVPLDQSRAAEEVLPFVGDAARGGHAVVRLLHVAPMPEAQIDREGRMLAFADQEMY